MTNNSKNDRRGFLNICLGASAAVCTGAILYPVARYLVPPETGGMVDSVNLGDIAEFRPGSATIFKFGRKPGILICTQEGEFRAFSATCTHLDCTVQFVESDQTLLCACHNGIYDLNGRNVSGPPPRPLERFSVNIQNNEIVLTKEA